jgi:hypothetical protein
MVAFCHEELRATQRSLHRASQRGRPMNDRDWKDEQRKVLYRMFETAFKRCEASSDEIGADIRLLGTVEKHSGDKIEGVDSFGQIAPPRL